METSGRWRERAGVAVVLALLCLLPLAALFSRDELGRWNVNRCAMSTPDEPSYLLMAKSIAGGHGISTVAVAGKDTFYPPGLPLVLAGWGKVFGFSIESMHVCVTLTLSAAVGLGFVLLRRIFALWGWSRPAWPALGVLAVFVTSYHVMEDVLFVFSEPLFMLAVLAWLYAALRLEKWWTRPGAATAVTALAVAATMARAAGVVCFAATMLYVVIGLVRGRRAAGQPPWLRRWAPPGCVLGVILAYYGAVHVMSPEKSIAAGADSSNSYTRQLILGVGFDIDRTTGQWHDKLYRPDQWGWRVTKAVGQQVWDHVRDFAAALVPPGREEDEAFRGVLYAYLGRLLLVIAGVGWGVKLMRGRPAPTRFVELFVGFYITLYLVWPFRMARFWIPILPLMAAYTADLLRSAWLRVRARPGIGRRHALLSLALGGLVIVLNVQELVRKLPWAQTRLNYVSDCLAASAATIRKASPDPGQTVVCLDDEAYFVFAWYLNPGEQDSGYRVQSARRGERIEAMILRNLRAVQADPRKRLFVPSYFGHDPRQQGEPTMLLVLRNLQQENPGMFVPSDPDCPGFVPLAPAKPGQWKIVKVQQDWNKTAVCEIVGAR